MIWLKPVKSQRQWNSKKKPSDGHDDHPISGKPFQNATIVGFFKYSLGSFQCDSTFLQGSSPVVIFTKWPYVIIYFQLNFGHHLCWVKKKLSNCQRKTFKWLSERGIESKRKRAGDVAGFEREHWLLLQTPAAGRSELPVAPAPWSLTRMWRAHTHTQRHTQRYV